MQIGIFNITYNTLPCLHLIKKINIKKNECTCDEDIVAALNRELMYNKLSSEHIYALAMNYNMDPLGIILIGVGTCSKCDADLRTLAIGLLLLGAEWFMCFHNHPNGNRTISNSDRELTGYYKRLGEAIGIEFVRHLMIARNTFEICEEL